MGPVISAVSPTKCLELSPLLIGRWNRRGHS